ncbi:MAG: DMT family transporter, partial [Cystobacter sp.]
YGLLYMATSHMTSGLVSVIFSSKVLMTTLNTSLFLRRPLERQVIYGGLLGLLGIGLIFQPQLVGMREGTVPVWGFALALLGTFVTSVGDVFSARNSSAGIPALQANAFGFLYSIGFLLLWVLARGIPFGFDPSPRYLGALVYLTVFGSVGAWLMYLELVARIGPARSGYMVALFPAVGLAVSAALEGLTLTPTMLMGVACTVLGNVIAMMRRPVARPVPLGSTASR